MITFVWGAAVGYVIGMVEWAIVSVLKARRDAAARVAEAEARRDAEDLG